MTTRTLPRAFQRFRRLRDPVFRLARLDQRAVVLQRRRALEEGAAEPVLEQLRALEEVAHVLVGVLQPLEVRDALVRLQREHEPLARLLAPDRE